MTAFATAISAPRHLAVALLQRVCCAHKASELVAAEHPLLIPLRTYNGDFFAAALLLLSQVRQFVFCSIVHWSCCCCHVRKQGCNCGLVTA